MIAEILAIGSELTSGAKLDTNSQWLSQRLEDLGIQVRFHTSVADDLDDNVRALRIASERADLVIISGGLGPTLDDLTREAMARLAGVPLVRDEASLTQIEAMFLARGRAMPERNRIQADFPAGSRPLENPIGSAPGIWMELPRPGCSSCLLAALPGVPSELKRMFQEQVAPRLPSTGLLIRRLRINCYGCGESQADELLGDLTARGRDPEIGITAHESTITLRIQAIAATEAECQRKIDEASAAIRDRLKSFVFGIEDEELEHVLIRELARRGETISTVDCGSRGWLAQTLARAAVENPQVFKGSLTFADGAAASTFLVAAESPEQLAAACRDQFQSTYALVIGELPEARLDVLARGDMQSEVGLASSTGYRRERITLNGNPAILWARLGKTVMNLLRLNL